MYLQQKCVVRGCHVGVTCMGRLGWESILCLLGKEEKAGGKEQDGVGRSHAGIELSALAKL